MVLEFDRVALAVANQEQGMQLREFRASLEDIVTSLANLPLVIVNPDMKSQSLARLYDGRLIAMQWGRWRLEPVGAGWPSDNKDLKQLPLWLDKVRDARSELASVRPQDAQLVALLFELEALASRQRYRSVLEHLPVVLAHLRQWA